MANDGAGKDNENANSSRPKLLLRVE